tara:strand:+ start:332 stop:544 length:213 start_codon:yes stop_codon:yes gene_type:complete
MPVKFLSVYIKKMPACQEAGILNKILFSYSIAAGSSMSEEVSGTTSGIVSVEISSRVFESINFDSEFESV